MKLDFVNKTGTKVRKEDFKKLLLKCCDVIKCEVDGVVGLSLISDDEITELNKVYRGKDEPTDVLSFSYLESEEIPRDDVLGEVFISVETAKKQSIDLGNELRTLFVHGLLHIFGFTHDTNSDENFMNDIVQKILT
ncbi:MAG: rRNA maturation RNase YbeY [Patescibacteria group bacterium]|nr:rRNA maturation RNase YbeY [Patescibacteria group bacterium]